MQDLYIQGLENLPELVLKTYSIPEIEHCVLVEIKGYVDTYSANHFLSQMDRIVDSGYHKIIFDCKELSYLSSTGIGTFTTIYKRVIDLKGNITFIYLQKSVREILDLLGFSQFFNIQANLESSMDFLKTDFQETSKIVSCPVCSKRLKISSDGKFKCGSCKTKLLVKNGKVFIA